MHWRLVLAGLALTVASAIPCAAQQAEQRSARNDALRDELLRMREQDQRYRTKWQHAITKANAGGSLPQQEIVRLQKTQADIDKRNMARLAEMIEQHGWPTTSLVGEDGDGADAAFLILQHADLASQKKYFRLLQDAATKGEARLANAAMLEDRILWQEGKKQIYGTQLHSGPETGGKLELWPIEDEEHVDERRAAVGLPPLAEYLKLLGVDYKPATTN